VSSAFSEFFPPRGRGTHRNPAGRFEKLAFTPDPDALEELRRADPEEEPEPRTPPDGAPSHPGGWRPPAPVTECLRDDSQSIISRNDSPDLGFSASLNPYRGCEHGCTYCYARPYHEYLGFSAGLDFETRILVKPEAPELLRRELRSPSWKPQTLACSGVTDCYQPVEKKFRITRACLEVLVEFGNPVAIVTKNRLVARDIDLLQKLAALGAASVVISLTTLDRSLAASMEPRAASPAARLETIRLLQEAGIPAGVSVAPVIPGLTDHEIPSLLEAARDHGASFAAHSLLRLPHGVADLFLDWLERLDAGVRSRVETRLRQVRGGALNDSRFGARMRGSGPSADALHELFRVAARRAGFRQGSPELSTEAFRPSGETQLRFW